MGALEKKPKSGDKPPTFLFKKFPEQRLSGLFGKKKTTKNDQLCPLQGLRLSFFQKPTNFKRYLLVQ